MAALELVPLVLQDIPYEVKSRGELYFEQKRVLLPATEKTSVLAVVKGQGGIYEVHLDWQESASRPKVHCSCPYFPKEGHCKHIWAVLLAAEKAGYLSGATHEPKANVPTNSQASTYEVSMDRVQLKTGQLEKLVGAKKAQALQKQLKNRSVRQQYEEEKLAAAKRRLEEEREKNSWMELMKSVQEDQHIGAPTAGIHQVLGKERRILYVIGATETQQLEQVALFLFVAERKKDGSESKPKRISFNSLRLDDWSEHPDYRLLRAILLDDSDEEGTDPRYHFGYRYRRPEYAGLSPVGTVEILPQLAATGNLYYSESESLENHYVEFEQLVPLAWDGAEPWDLVIDIEADEESWWRVTGRLIRGEETQPLTKVTLTTANQFGCLFISNNTIMQVRVPSHVGWLRLFATNASFRFPEEHRPQFLQEFGRLATPPQVNAPANFNLPQLDLPLTPVIKLERPAVSRYGVTASETELHGRVYFQYGEIRIRSSTPGTILLTEDRQQAIPRNIAGENDAVHALATSGVSLGPIRYGFYGTNDPADFSLPTKKLTALVSKLASGGWLIEAEGSIIRSANSYSFSVTSGVDWFDLDAKFDFAGVELKLPALLAAIRKGERLVTLGDGTQGILPEEWLKKFGFLADLGEDGTEKIRFKSSQGLLLDALLASQPNVQWDERFGEWRQKLKSFQGVHAEKAPTKFTGTLRTYQQEGLGWMTFLREFGFGGCLADDMGLGKTVQVLALLQARRQESNAKKKRRPNLIVVPRSLIFNWKQEAARFTPELKVLDFAGVGRKTMWEQVAERDIVLTTYGTLLKDVAQLKDLEFDYLILDEAQAIKNSAAQCSKACRLLTAQNRLALTGTPIENHLGELWSLFDFLNPGMLGQSTAFQRFAKGAADGEAEGREVLSRAIAPFVLRRTKSQVLKDLPEKTEQTIYCDLSAKERKKYNELKEFYRQSLTTKIKTSGLEKSKIHVLEALLRLRQASCHLGLLDEKEQKNASAKLETLLEQLEELLAEGHKALVFSQFTSLLAIVEKHLKKQKIVYEYLDGQTRDRQARVERFQTDPECQLFLISLKAGGKGLNLTAADYVFILDPWWNPAVEAQAIDRAHRLGQDKPVFAYRLIARDTVEEKILELQEGKRNLAESIISADTSVLKGLTAADLELLLS